MRVDRPKKHLRRCAWRAAWNRAALRHSKPSSASSLSHWRMIGRLFEHPPPDRW